MGKKIESKIVYGRAKGQANRGAKAVRVRFEVGVKQYTLFVPL